MLASFCTLPCLFLGQTVILEGGNASFRSQVREIAMEKPLLNKEYEATLKRVDRSNIISCDSFDSIRPVPFIPTLSPHYPLRYVS